MEVSPQTSCSMKGVPAGGSHAPQQWQTVINTNLGTLCTLRKASILPHFESIHASCPCAATLGRRSQSTNTSHEPDREWMGIDWTRHSGVCAPDPAAERIQGGRWRCDGVDPLFTHIFWSLQNNIFSKPCEPSQLLSEKWNSARVWLRVHNKSSFQLHRLRWSIVHTKYTHIYIPWWYQGHSWHKSQPLLILQPVQCGVWLLYMGRLLHRLS